MRGLKKSKRVSWASDVNLCQTRLFLSDEFPSQVGLGAQDHLQAKISGPPPLHTEGTGCDDNMPPGFEGAQPANLLINKLAQLPIPKWRCPPMFVMDPTWQVVAGDESQQVEVQNQREMRMLEAVYPRPSAIPPNPSELQGIKEECHYNDQDTPSIPITPIEDEDSAMDSSFELPPQISSTSQCNAISYPQPPANGNAAAGLALGVAPDVAAAAYAALTSVMTNSSQGKLIDSDLLTRILSDPKLVDKLVKINRTEPAGPSLPTTSTSGPFYPPPNIVRPVPNLRPNPPEVPAAPKDINYYKSLIQQHGGERQEPPLLPPQFPNSNNFNRNNLVANPEQAPVHNNNSFKTLDMKPRIMKPCIYFNSTRGCRHGVNCSYIHDPVSQHRSGGGMMPEVPRGAKRMKVEREIRGT